MYSAIFGSRSNWSDSVIILIVFIIIIIAYKLNSFLPLLRFSSWARVPDHHSEAWGCSSLSWLCSPLESVLIIIILMLPLALWPSLILFASWADGCFHCICASGFRHLLCARRSHRAALMLRFALAFASIKKTGWCGGHKSRS